MAVQYFADIMIIIMLSSSLLKLYSMVLNCSAKSYTVKILWCYLSPFLRATLLHTFSRSQIKKFEDRPRNQCLRLRSRTKFCPRGQLGLKDLTSLLITNYITVEHDTHTAQFVKQFTYCYAAIQTNNKE